VGIVRKELSASLRVGAAILLLVVLVRQVSWAAILENLARAAPLPAAGAVLLAVPNVLLQSAKWWILVRDDLPGLSHGAALRSLLAGLPVGLATPGRVGEMARGALLGVGDPVRLSGAFILDKALNLGPLLAVSAVGAFAVARPFWGPGAAAATSAGFALAALGHAFVCLRPEAARSRLRGRGPGEDSLPGRFLGAFAAVRPDTSARALWLSAAFYATVLLQYVLLLRALAPDTSLGAATAAFAAICAAGSLPITPGGLGTREAAAMVVLEPMGVPAAAAVNSSLLIFGLNVVAPALIGIPVLARGRRESAA
jgi:uncharacterized membrane protein YbhN (UPF0104 family)